MAPSKKKPIQTAVTAKIETEVKKKRGTKTRKNAQEKTKLKTPTVLKIKLPKINHESVLPVNNAGTISNKTGRLLPQDIKIQMANEVLKTILPNKKSKENNVSLEAPTLNGPNPERKHKSVKVKTVLQTPKRGQKKKNVENTPTVEPEADPVTTAGSEDVTVKLPAKVKITKKRVQKKAVENVVPKETTASTEKKPRAKKRKIVTDITNAKKSNCLQLKQRNKTNETINNIALEIENNICKTDEIQPPLQNEASDHSRRTSMSSMLSWTKDISSSSTTTCFTVKSDDFFRIDNKIPVLEIKKADSYTCLPRVSSSSSNSDSSSSGSSITSKETPTVTKSIPELNTRSPILSISSISKVASDNSPRQQQNKYTDEMDTFEKALKALDKVKLMMNSFNLEILNWIGYPDDSEKLNPKTKSRLKIIDQLKPENDIVRLCQKFEEKIDKQQKVESMNVECIENENSGLVKCSSTFSDEHCDFSHLVEIDTNNYSPIQSDDDTEYSDKQDYLDNSVRDKKANYANRDTNRDQGNQSYLDEDDDVISLFAEGSISGAESYRNSIIVGPVQDNKEKAATEEYIPLPVSSQLAQVSYKPSKIDNQPNGIFKHPNIIQKTNVTQPVNKNNEDLKRDLDQSNKPILMASVFGQKRVKSVVFKDICYFNLISMCNRDNCGYPHNKLDAHTVKNKLVRLREDVFIREYIHIRNWPVLRRTYGMYYVQECFRRELTNILIEMAIDFSMQRQNHTAEDVALSIEVMETALLHLNKIDLQSCKDLLNYNMNNGVLLCDNLMHTIAVTQNFSRFKVVFINLTNFIVEQGKRFSVEVAENLVERLSILPIEEPVSKALIIILRNTDASALQNPRISQYETQLLKFNSDLYKELQLLKVQVVAPTSLTRYESVEQERFPGTPTQDVPIIEDATPTPIMPVIITVTNKYANNTLSSNESYYRHNQNDRFGYRDKVNCNGRDQWPKRPGMFRGVKRRFDQRNINFGGQIPKYPPRN